MAQDPAARPRSAFGDFGRLVGRTMSRTAGAPHTAQAAGTPSRDSIGVRLEMSARLAERYHELAAAPDLTRFERSVSSQSGEDGVIAEVLSRIGTTTKWFVEFGASRGIQANCVLLADVFAWNGLFIEASPDAFTPLEWKYRSNERVRTLEAFVTPANIEQLFDQADVPSEPDVLSIDVDGVDWWIWRALSNYKPRLVVTEYNGALDVREKLTVPSEFSGWDVQTSYFGASLGAFEVLAAAKGYRLVHTELTGTNAFWVREDLFEPFAELEVPRRSSNYWLVGAQLDAPPPGSRWVDVSSLTSP